MSRRARFICAPGPSARRRSFSIRSRSGKGDGLVSGKAAGDLDEVAVFNACADCLKAETAVFHHPDPALFSSGHQRTLGNGRRSLSGACRDQHLRLFSKAEIGQGRGEGHVHLKLLGDPVAFPGKAGHLAGEFFPRRGTEGDGCRLSGRHSLELRFVHIGLDPNGLGVGQQEDRQPGSHRGAWFKLPPDDDPVLRGQNQGVVQPGAAGGHGGSGGDFFPSRRVQGGSGAGCFFPGDQKGGFILFRFLGGNQFLGGQGAETFAVLFGQQQAGLGLLQIGLLQGHCGAGFLRCGGRLPGLRLQLGGVQFRQNLSALDHIPLIGADLGDPAGNLAGNVDHDLGFHRAVAIDLRYQIPLAKVHHLHLGRAKNSEPQEKAQGQKPSQRQEMFFLYLVGNCLIVLPLRLYCLPKARSSLARAILWSYPA